MSSRRSIGLTLLFMPLLVLGVAALIPCYSAGLSLVLHGLPLARVVAKENLDVFQFVTTDSLASKGIVFSGGRAVGWICQPLGSFASYVPFSGRASFDDIGAFDFRFNIPLLITSNLRWWLLPIQAVTLLLWLRSREKRIRYSVP